MDLMLQVNQLMPSGKPKYLDVIQYPKISDLIKQEGARKILLLLAIMVRDFCASFNVVRNMNEDQILEAAGMLMEECGNFRLEDYVIMFSMAKKGQLVKVFDRIDLEVITNVLDAYWQNRNEAANKAQESEFSRIDGLGEGNAKDMVWNGFKYENKKDAGDRMESLAGMMGDLKNKLKDAGL